jgi:hypothetical protein
VVSSQKSVTYVLSPLQVIVGHVLGDMVEVAPGNVPVRVEM